VRKDKIVSRIEKLVTDLNTIPSINKKILGSDGLKNEYYFFPFSNEKILVKKVKNGNNKDYEWREYTTEVYT
jgi:hypothetical protein